MVIRCLIRIVICVDLTFPGLASGENLYFNFWNYDYGIGGINFDSKANTFCT